MIDYGQLTKNIQGRLNPDSEYLVERKLFSDLSDDPTDVLKYIKLAMRGVEPEYTQKSKEAGERVKEDAYCKNIVNIEVEEKGNG